MDPTHLDDVPSPLKPNTVHQEPTVRRGALDPVCIPRASSTAAPTPRPTQEAGSASPRPLAHRVAPGDK